VVGRPARVEHPAVAARSQGTPSCYGLPYNVYPTFGREGSVRWPCATGTTWTGIPKC
jgi:hypothetical protein